MITFAKKVFMKISQINHLLSVCRELAEQDKLPISYAIARNLALLEPISFNASKELFDVVRKYATKDENGAPKVLPNRPGNNFIDFEYGDQVEHAVAEYEAIQSREVSIDLYQANIMVSKQYLDSNPKAKYLTVLLECNVIQDVAE
jgi:hypothetical protein